MTTTRHGGRWTLDDRAGSVHQQLPVDVPPGSGALAVELRYDAAGGVLDLGCEGPAGFRGWSGGARSHYTVTASWATPGYLPGELEPGTWNVLLGLHRIPPAGVEFEVTATVTERPPPEPVAPTPPPLDARPPARILPEVDGRRWMPGDFHSHTVHSDGALTVDELAHLAASRGLEFLAVTDHNTISHHRELPATGARYGLMLVPGQEVTTDLGHAGALGPIGWIDFRRPADDWVVEVEAQNGIVSINHPLSGDCAWRHPLARRPQVVEVWHSSWFDRRWGAPLAWAYTWRPDVIAIGGGDFHRHGKNAAPGTPTTWVLADGDDVLGALSAGRTAVSADPSGPLLLRMGDELLAVDADGLMLVRPDNGRTVIHGDHAAVPAEPGLHHLETFENEIIALCT